MNTTRMVRQLAAAAVMAAALPAFAQGPNYNYIEAGYGYFDIDDVSGAGEDGYWAGFSARLADPIYLNGSFQRYEIDTFLFSEDLDLISANLGYRAAINDTTDFNFELGYEDLDLGGFGTSGVRGALGLRGQPTTSLEGRAFAGYTVDDGFDDGAWFLGLQGAYAFSQRWAATLQLETYEFDFNVARGGIRLMF